MRHFTGTSGFAYREWKGSFYPRDLPPSAMLAYYAERFTAVEINNTFYRMPSEEVLRQWIENVPEEFIFAIKAPQEITHRKRLKGVEEPMSRFFTALDALGNHLGPVLVQLPPNMKKDAARLAAFLELPPPGTRVALEFRHESWFDDEVFDILRGAGAALCVTHGERTPVPMVATTTWGYLRLRQGHYTDAELAEWADAVRAEASRWSDVFAFFMHEDTGTGPVIAVRWNSELKKSE